LKNCSSVAFTITMKRIVPDETLLFQYSALGFNSHKIHLDRTFARETEAFPDLVVNGGLATLLLTEFLRLELKGAFTSLTAKHVAPLFCGRPISLWGDVRMMRGYCAPSTTMASWLWTLRRGHDSRRLATAARRSDWDRR
jgi:hydroxyacyl-ACP dehydratase HTD2-like protein with hotdog domain